MPAYLSNKLLCSVRKVFKHQIALFFFLNDKVVLSSVMMIYDSRPGQVLWESETGRPRILSLPDFHFWPGDLVSSVSNRILGESAALITSLYRLTLQRDLAESPLWPGPDALSMLSMIN